MFVTSSGEPETDDETPILHFCARELAASQAGVAQNLKGQEAEAVIVPHQLRLRGKLAFSV